MRTPATRHGRASIKGGGARRRRREPPQDLIDFYRRWSDFREVASAIARRADLSPLQRETVKWLVMLADRIGEQDIAPRDHDPHRR